MRIAQQLCKTSTGNSSWQEKKGLLEVAFFLFDQMDLTMGIWVFIYLLIRPSLLLVLWSFLLTVVLHVTISSVGYLLGMRKTIT